MKKLVLGIDVGGIRTKIGLVDLTDGEVISRAGAHVMMVEEPEVSEKFSVLNNIVPFDFMAYYQADKFNAGKTFSVGGKIPK